MKKRTQQPEQFHDEDERSFWRRAFLRGLPDCTQMESAQGCVHIAAEIADAALVEDRNRANGKRSGK